VWERAGRLQDACDTVLIDTTITCLSSQSNLNSRVADSQGRTLAGLKAAENRKKRDPHIQSIVKAYDALDEYEAGDTSDLVLDCGGTVSFTQSFVYLGSLLHRDLSDHHDVDARIKKASKAFGALRNRIFGTRDVSERLKGKIYTGGVLAVLLYGCESWCLTAESISRLRNWHNKRIREMCRMTMCQSFVHQISSVSLQKRTGVFSIEYYLASRTLLWAGHVARMPKSRLPQMLTLSWVHEPRIAGGQEMTYGRSLERHLKHFGLMDDGG